MDTLGKWWWLRPWKSAKEMNNNYVNLRNVSHVLVEVLEKESAELKKKADEWEKYQKAHNMGRR